MEISSHLNIFHNYYHTYLLFPLRFRCGQINININFRNFTIQKQFQSKTKNKRLTHLTINCNSFLLEWNASVCVCITFNSTTFYEVV